MTEDLRNFEVNRLQLVASLNAVATAMRQAGEHAETLAQIVKTANLGSGATFITDGGEKGTKRKRKPKDPNAPKRPASSYLMFQNEVRRDLKKENPNMTNQELMALIGKLWADMAEKDKAIYHNAAASAKEEYSAQKQAYAARSPEEVAAANEATATKEKEKVKRQRAAPKSATVVAGSPTVPPVAVEKTASSESEASDEEESSEEEVQKGKKQKNIKGKSDEESSESEDESVEEKPVLKKPKIKGPPAPPSVPVQKKKKSVK